MPRCGLFRDVRIDASNARLPVINTVGVVSVSTVVSFQVF
jgi:hypothetical protein